MSEGPTAAVSKRALVASDSPIARDPRVLKQVRWLTEMGYSVDTLGRGDRAPEVNGEHFAMQRRSVAARVLAYLLLPNRVKYKILIGSTIPAAVTTRPYDVVVTNEIELLPWFVNNQHALLSASGTSHLDLHEYAPSQRVGIAYRLVFKRYRDWLITFIPSPAFSTRSVVASGIARLYAERFGIEPPSVVRSCPSFVDQEPSPVDARNIRLIHHGIASSSRRLELLIEAMKHVNDGFQLELMLVGSEEAISPLKRLAAPLGSRVTFRTPVDVRDVAKALNEYDLEIIFIPPLTDNLRFGLPNKFFEAVQGRLGLVIGESPEMVATAREFDNAVVVQGWSAAALAMTINQLRPERVEALKQGSHRAAPELSAEMEKARFIAAIS